MPDPRVLQAKFRNPPPPPPPPAQRCLSPRSSRPQGMPAHQQPFGVTFQHNLSVESDNSLKVSPLHELSTPPRDNHHTRDYSPSTSSVGARQELEYASSVANSELRRLKFPSDLTNQELFIQRQERKIQELLVETKNLKKQLARARVTSGPEKQTRSLTPVKPAADSEDIILGRQDAQLIALHKRLQAAEKENHMLRPDRGSGSEGSSTPKRELAGSVRRSVCIQPSPRGGAQERPPWQAPEVGAAALSRDLDIPIARNKEHAIAAMERRNKSKYAHVRPRLYNAPQRPTQASLLKVHTPRSAAGSASNRCRSNPGGSVRRLPSRSSSAARSPRGASPSPALVVGYSEPAGRPGRPTASLPSPVTSTAPVPISPQEYARVAQSLAPMLGNSPSRHFSSLPPQIPFPGFPGQPTSAASSGFLPTPPRGSMPSPSSAFAEGVSPGLGTPSAVSTAAYVAREYYIDPATGEQIEASDFKAIAHRLRPSVEFQQQLDSRNNLQQSSKAQPRRETSVSPTFPLAHHPSPVPARVPFAGAGPSPPQRTAGAAYHGAVPSEAPSPQPVHHPRPPVSRKPESWTMPSETF